MPPPSSPPGSSLPSVTPPINEIRVYQHSQLFYWWPVWACGFVMAIWTFIDGHRMAIVPKDTVIHSLGGGRYSLETQDKSPAALEGAAARNQNAFPLHVSQNSRLGAIFAVVLLLVIVITTMPLRGLWSVVVIVTIVLVSISLAA